MNEFFQYLINNLKNMIKRSPNIQNFASRSKLSIFRVGRAYSSLIMVLGILQENLIKQKHYFFQELKKKYFTKKLNKKRDKKITAFMLNKKILFKQGLSYIFEIFDKRKINYSISLFIEFKRKNSIYKGLRMIETFFQKKDDNFLLIGFTYIDKNKRNFEIIEINRKFGCRKIKAIIQRNIITKKIDIFNIIRLFGKINSVSRNSKKLSNAQTMLERKSKDNHHRLSNPSSDKEKSLLEKIFRNQVIEISLI